MTRTLYGEIFCNKTLCLKAQKYHKALSGVALITEAFMQQIVHTIYPPATPYAKVCKLSSEHIGVVMPNLTGSLHTFLSKDGANPLDAVAQVVYALHRVRSDPRVQYVAHRDLHPGNVMGKNATNPQYQEFTIGGTTIGFRPLIEWQIIDWGMACMKVEGVKIETTEKHAFANRSSCNPAIDLTVLMHKLLLYPSTAAFAEQFFDTATHNQMKMLIANGDARFLHFGYYAPKDNITPELIFEKLSLLPRYMPRGPAGSVESLKRQVSQSPYDKRTMRKLVY